MFWVKVQAFEKSLGDEKHGFWERTIKHVIEPYVRRRSIQERLHCLIGGILTHCKRKGWISWMPWQANPRSGNKHQPGPWDGKSTSQRRYLPGSGNLFKSHQGAQYHALSCLVMGSWALGTAFCNLPILKSPLPPECYPDSHKPSKETIALAPGALRIMRQYAKVMQFIHNEHGINSLVWNCHIFLTGVTSLLVLIYFSGTVS